MPPVSDIRPAPPSLPAPPQPVDMPFMQFFTASTKQAYDGITSMDTLAAAADVPAADASPATSSGGGVSSGAAAGIGIGCAIAGMLIGALAMRWHSRRAGWKRHGDPALPGSIAASESYKL